jgi:hypothetical protein
MGAPGWDCGACFAGRFESIGGAPVLLLSSSRRSSQRNPFPPITNNHPQSYKTTKPPDHPRPRLQARRALRRRRRRRRPRLGRLRPQHVPGDAGDGAQRRVVGPLYADRRAALFGGGQRHGGQVRARLNHHLPTPTNSWTHHSSLITIHQRKHHQPPFRRINEFIWTNIPAARNEGLPYHHPNWEEIHHQTSGPQFEAERAAAAAAAA